MKPARVAWPTSRWSRLTTALPTLLVLFVLLSLAGAAVRALQYDWDAAGWAGWAAVWATVAGLFGWYGGIWRHWQTRALTTERERLLLALASAQWGQRGRPPAIVRRHQRRLRRVEAQLRRLGAPLAGGGR